MIRICIISMALMYASIGHAIERASPSSTPELTIQRVDASGLVDVALSPTKKGPTRIFRPGSSWGAANWRVFVVRDSHLLAFRENPDQRFSRNSPWFEELQETKKIALNIKSEMWIGPKMEFGTFRSGDKVIVAYDVPVTGEARQYGVWYGTISAMTAVN